MAHIHTNIYLLTYLLTYIYLYTYYRGVYALEPLVWILRVDRRQLSTRISGSISQLVQTLVRTFNYQTIVVIWPWSKLVMRSLVALW